MIQDYHLGAFRETFKIFVIRNIKKNNNPEKHTLSIKQYILYYSILY